MSRTRINKVEPKAMPAGALELVAARFRILAEPMRLRLLNELRGGEQTVSRLVETTGAGQANVSKHLGLLAEAGMEPSRIPHRVWDAVAGKRWYRDWLAKSLQLMSEAAQRSRAVG